MTTLNEIIQSFRYQSQWCRSFDAPFTAHILETAADDLQGKGALTKLIGNWSGDPFLDVLPLRFVSAIQSLVLSGKVPELIGLYPPHTEICDPAKIWPVVTESFISHSSVYEEFLGWFPQTNEVGRSGVLLGGFLTIAQDTGLPLRLFEIGASAGLNSLWPYYCYRLGSTVWGDKNSPVQIDIDWKGGLPPLETPLQIVSTSTSDLSPIDLNHPAQRLRLRSYVWAGQDKRLARLDGAIAIAEKMGVAIEKADAAIWLEKHLKDFSPGAVTVLYHSIMWHFVPKDAQDRITDLMNSVGSRATNEFPLAWLRFEMVSKDNIDMPELTLTQWPGGKTRILARAHTHGTWVEWLDATN